MVFNYTEHTLPYLDFAISWFIKNDPVIIGHYDSGGCHSDQIADINSCSCFAHTSQLYNDLCRSVFLNKCALIVPFFFLFFFTVFKYSNKWWAKTFATHAIILSLLFGLIKQFYCFIVRDFKSNSI